MLIDFTEFELETIANSMEDYINYDELLLLTLHLPNECKHLNNKLDNAIKDFEELNHLNNIALLYQMYEN